MAIVGENTTEAVDKEGQGSVMGGIRFLSGSPRPPKNASFRRIRSSPTGAPGSKSSHGRRRKASSSKPHRGVL